MVQHAGASRLGQELGAEPDEPSRRNPVVEPYPARAVIHHLDHRALAKCEQLGHDPEIVVWDVDGHHLHRLVNLAVDLAGEHLRFTDRELEALTPHGLHEHRQLELPAALDLPDLRALGRLGRASDTLPMISASSRLFNSRAVILVPSVPARGDVLIPIVIVRLGSSTVMAGRGLGSSGSASVSPIVMSVEAGDCGDLSGPGLVGGDPVERLRHVEIGDLLPFDRPVEPAPRHDVALCEGCRCGLCKLPTGQRMDSHRDCRPVPA